MDDRPDQALVFRHVYHQLGNIRLLQLGTMLVQGAGVTDTGEEHYFPYRLTKEQRDAASRALFELHEIVKHPSLEPNPRGIAIEQAKADVEFQGFLQATLAPVKRKPRGGTRHPRRQRDA